MARIIAVAGVRLVADRKGLGASIRREFRTAIREAMGGGSLFDDVDRDSDATARRVGNRWSAVLGGLRTALTGLVSGFAGIGRLLLIGTAAAGAVAGIVSVTAAVAGLGAAVVTASGVLGLLPAALAGIAAIKGTLALAMSGVSEGFKAMSEDAATFNEAIKDLAPNAQSFLRAIRDQKSAFDDLRLDVQNRFFAGLSDTIKPLAERYLPLARDLFGGIADSLNQAAREAANFALDAEVVGQTSNLFGNLRQAVANLAPAFAPALSALLDITEVGSRFLPGITQSITDMSTRFAEFIRDAAGSGALEAFFQRAIDTVKQLGRIIGNVFEGLGNVMDAAQAEGLGLLSTIEQITAAFAEWTGSASGQTALRSFFASIKRVVDALAPAFLALVEVIARDLFPILADIAEIIGPVLGPLFQTFGRLLQALRPLIAAIADAFATALEALGPFFDALGEAITDAMPVLGPLIQDIGEAFAQLFEAMVPLAPLFVDLVEALLPIIPPFIQMVADLMPRFIDLIEEIMPLIQAWAEVFVQALPIFADIAGFFLDVFIPVIGFVIDIISGLLTIFTTVATGMWTIIQTVFQTIASVWTSIWTAISNVFSGIWESIKALFSEGLNGMVNRVGQFAGELWSATKDALSRMGSAVGEGIDNVGRFFRELPGRINDWLAGIGQWLYNAGRDLVNGLINGIKAKVQQVIDSVVGMVNDAIGAARAALGMNSPSKVFADVGKNIGLGLVNGLEGITPAVADAAAAMAGVTTDAFGNPFRVTSNGGGGITPVGGTVVNQTNVMQSGTDVKQFSDLVLGRGMGDFMSGASTLMVARNGVQAGVNDQWIGV